MVDIILLESIEGETMLLFCLFLYVAREQDQGRKREEDREEVLRTKVRRQVRHKIVRTNDKFH